MNQPPHSPPLARGDRIVTNQTMDMNGPIIPDGTTGIVASVSGDWVECRFDGHHGIWQTTLRTLDRLPSSPAPSAASPTAQEPEDAAQVADLVAKLATGDPYYVTRAVMDAIKELSASSKTLFVTQIMERLRHERFQTPAEWSYSIQSAAELFAVGLALSGPGCIDAVLQYGEAEYARPDCRRLAALALGNTAKRNDPGSIPADAAQRAVAYLMKVIASADPLDQMAWQTAETLGHFGAQAAAARELVAATASKIDPYEHRRVLDIYQDTLLRIGG